MIGTYVLIGLIVLVLLFAKMSLVIIPQSETKIIERLGKYYATLKPGINIIIPFIDRPKTIITLVQGRYTYSNSIDKTVFLPYEASNLMGSLGGIKELFK